MILNDLLYVSARYDLFRRGASLPSNFSHLLPCFLCIILCHEPSSEEQVTIIVRAAECCVEIGADPNSESIREGKEWQEYYWQVFSYLFVINPLMLIEWDE